MDLQQAIFWPTLGVVVVLKAEFDVVVDIQTPLSSEWVPLDETDFQILVTKKTGPKLML